MIRALTLLLLVATVRAQGGRDGATGVLFLAWDVSVESDAIHRTAWRALEPHNVARRRIATFAGDAKRALAYLRANKSAPIVVAYDPKIAALASRELPKAAVLKVYEEQGAHVHARTDRRRFYAAKDMLLGGLGPAVENVDRPDSRILGFDGFDWVQEGAPRRLGDKPILSTSGHVPEGRAVLTMRPDPRSLGLHVAAQVLSYLRSKKPFRHVTVKRMRLTVDLGAAKRANITVPLKLLARADVVRRSR